MFPTGYASSGDEYIEKGKAMHAKLAAEGFADGRITLSWAPHAPYTVADAQWLELKQLATEMGCTIHTHLHETADEVECSCKLDTTSSKGMVRLRPSPASLARLASRAVRLCLTIVLRTVGSSMALV